MSSDRSIFVWQPLLTDHARFTLDALAMQVGSKITAVTEKVEDKVRKQQGWTNSQTDLIAEVRLERWRDIGSLLKARDPCADRVDIFWAPFWRPKLLIAMIFASFGNSRIFLVSEPYPESSTSYFGIRQSVFDRIKTVLRPLLYRSFVQLLGGRIEGIFAISKLAVAQYEQAGYPVRQIHPFGYFVPTKIPEETDDTARAPDRMDNPSLVFVGSLIPRKGPDILIDAVRKANGAFKRLTASYFGPGEPDLFDFDGHDNVYKGEIPFGSSGKTMSMYDAVVVPSRHDGWAVVVNEAIGAGVPVICSRDAGASVLIEKFGGGLIFDPHLEGSLLSILEAICANPSLLDEMRGPQVDAAKSIQPAVAAEYMKAIICPAQTGSPMKAPWY